MATATPGPTIGPCLDDARTEAGERRRSGTHVFSAHHPLGGTDVAVIVLGHHHGCPRSLSRAERRTDAPVVAMEHVEPSGREELPDACPEPWIRHRHGVGAVGVAEQLRHVLRSGPNAVDRDLAVPGGSLMTVHRDGGHLDTVATLGEHPRQALDVHLLSTDDRWVELGDHQNTHTRST